MLCVIETAALYALELTSRTSGRSWEGGGEQSIVFQPQREAGKMKLNTCLLSCVCNRQGGKVIQRRKGMKRSQRGKGLLSL